MESIKVLICTRCKEEKEVGEFSRTKKKRGYSCWCKKCHRDYDTGGRRVVASYVLVTEKKCCGCQNIYPASEFYLNKSSKDGLNHYCSLCRKKNRKANQLEINKIWRANNVQSRLWYSARAGARSRNIEFNISKEDIIVPAHCPVLGIPLDIDLSLGMGKNHAPSIDRIDNSIGYIRGNIVVVSFRANNLKRDASIVELQKLAHFYGNLSLDKT